MSQDQKAVQTDEEMLCASIARLYEVFSKYRLGEHVEGCPCCTSAEDSIRIRSKKLEELSETDLARFGFKAMTTWGSVDDFKHFLPRLFELVATRDESNLNCHLPTLEHEVTIGKLAYGKWSTWSQGTAKK